MNVDISKHISGVKTQITSSSDKQATKDIRAPHRNEEVAKIAEKVKQEALSAKNVRMNYDSDIDRVVITVVDSQSQEVVRQIPWADSITFMKRFQQIIEWTTNKRV
ncbi:MAG: flagellar protein FlaG [Proteobacteria bacterium]|nr:flagellar protein FlaG [Pseudomonadota bacterium]